jgi:hypothetical protein
VVGYCECGNERPSSIKSGNFVISLLTKLFKNNPGKLVGWLLEASAMQLPT